MALVPTVRRTVCFCVVVALLVLPVAGLAAATLVEKVTAVRGLLVIPYSKYVLPNGLTLIVHEDHSDPLVHVDVTYHVGSAREEIGKSGFAHFFEHMMFQGSDHVADEQHFKIITEAGGTLNGSTNILLVGDKAKVLPGLQRLGYEIVELDVYGNRTASASR